jgi:hypothetical protein
LLAAQPESTSFEDDFVGSIPIPNTDAAVKIGGRRRGDQPSLIAGSMSTTSTFRRTLITLAQSALPSIYSGLQFRGLMLAASFSGGDVRTTMATVARPDKYNLERNIDINAVSC